MRRTQRPPTDTDFTGRTTWQASVPQPRAPVAWDTPDARDARDAPLRTPIASVRTVEVIPPRRTTREVVALETGMAALAHAVHRPIALELIGTASARRFVVRAADAGSLEEVVRQIRARYPQAIIRPLASDEDALHLAPGEALTALELRPGAGPYLPLRTPGARERVQEGADPLLGLLAAFSSLPSDMRTVVQLALAPARDAWSAPHQRMALEHALEPERARERWQLAQSRTDPGSGGELGLPLVLGLLALVGVAVLAQRYGSRLPAWLRQDASELLRQRGLVHLTPAQLLWLVACGGVLLFALVMLLVCAAWVRGRIRGWLHPMPLYDQQLVQEKTGRVAYHARLRLLVIGPDGPPDVVPGTVRRAARQSHGGKHGTANLSRSEGVALESRPDILTTTSPRAPAKAQGAAVFAGVSSASGVFAASPATRHWYPGNVWTLWTWWWQLGRQSWRRTCLRASATLRAIRTNFVNAAPVRVVVGLWRAAPSARLRLARRYIRMWVRDMQRSRRRIALMRTAVRWQARLRRETLEGFLSAYRQYHLANGGYFVPHWLSRRAAQRIVTPVTPAGRLGRHRRHHRAIGWQRGVRGSAHMLSVADVAALWHLPQADDLADLPFVERTRARTLLVPSALSQAHEAFRVGLSTHAGHTLPVCLPSDATRRNALAIAKTGKGKSTLLLSLARAALSENDCGLVLIDPHGDLAETVLALIPEHRRDDVLLVDLGDRVYPIGLNPLDVTLNPDRDKAVSNMIAVFSQIWKDFWGPRMESALEAALKTLHEANQVEVERDPQDGPDRQLTLLDATPLMTFAAFRHSLMARVQDPALTEFWMRFEALQPRLQQDIITPVTTKLDKFAHSVVARRIVGQGRSTLNMAEAIQQNRVILVKTARGIVGHDTSSLIGATLLGFLQVTVGEQAAIEAERRRRARVLVDEFQTLEGVDFGAMLSELRKYGASFALATQALSHLDALDRTLRPTVLANVDQLFAFAMSAEDARMVERELDGVVEATDLINLDDFSCYARLTIHGRRAPVFSLALDPPPALDTKAWAQAEVLRRRSQRRLGRFVDSVDTLIAHAALRRKALAEQHQHQQHSQRGQREGEPARRAQTHSATGNSPRQGDPVPSERPGLPVPQRGDPGSHLAGRPEHAGANMTAPTVPESGNDNTTEATDMSKVPDTTTTARLDPTPARQTSSQEGASTNVSSTAKSGKRRSNWGRKRRSPNHGFTALLSEGQLAGNAPRAGEWQPADDGRDARDGERDGEDAARRDPRASTAPRAAASATEWEGEEASADDHDDDDPEDDPEDRDEGEHAP